jgi:hypothetical protein
MISFIKSLFKKKQPVYLSLTRTERLRVLKDHGLKALHGVETFDISRLLKTSVMSDDTVPRIVDEILTNRMVRQIQNEIAQEADANAKTAKESKRKK